MNCRFCKEKIPEIASDWVKDLKMCGVCFQKKYNKKVEKTIQILNDCSLEEIQAFNLACGFVYNHKMRYGNSAKLDLQEAKNV